MFSYKDILWVKNVKRDKGQGWAYETVDFDEEFLLNWPTSKKGSASTPNIGDIIVLFQKPNFVNGKKNKKVHLTHLVSPVSIDLFIDENSLNHKWCRRVKLIAKANPIEIIPNSGSYNFFKPNRGLTNPIINLENRVGLTELEKKQEIWQLFQNYLSHNLSKSNLDYKIGEHGEFEGDKTIREHIKQEIARRNASIVQRAKKLAYEMGNGKLLCECCDFDFYKKYGQIGEMYIECHHKIHLSTGERITRLSDLALVCSNCHRILHRRNNNGEYLTVPELRCLIMKVKQEALLV